MLHAVSCRPVADDAQVDRSHSTSSYAPTTPKAGASGRNSANTASTSPSANHGVAAQADEVGHRPCAKVGRYVESMYSQPRNGNAT